MDGATHSPAATARAVTRPARLPAALSAGTGLPSLSPPRRRPGRPAIPTLREMHRAASRVARLHRKRPRRPEAILLSAPCRR